MYTDETDIHGLDIGFDGPKIEKNKYNPSTSLGEEHRSRAPYIGVNKDPTEVGGS
jgi:hypothetical protein